MIVWDPRWYDGELESIVIRTSMYLSLLCREEQTRNKS
jgi:hypothetical protein